MTYSTGTPLKAVAGRLALDFVNTADWTPFDTVLKDRIHSLVDLSEWTAQMGLAGAYWDGTLEASRDFGPGCVEQFLAKAALIWVSVSRRRKFPSHPGCGDKPCATWSPRPPCRSLPTRANWPV